MFNEHIHVHSTRCDTYILRMSALQLNFVCACVCVRVERNGAHMLNERESLTTIMYRMEQVFFLFWLVRVYCIIATTTRIRQFKLIFNWKIKQILFRQKQLYTIFIVMLNFKFSDFTLFSSILHTGCNDTNICWIETENINDSDEKIQTFLFENCEK